MNHPDLEKVIAPLEARPRVLDAQRFVLKKAGQTIASNTKLRFGKLLARALKKIKRRF